MFGKTKKNKIQELIEQDGIDHATQRFADIINDMLQTKELAYQFVLEEIEAASQGNDEAIRFASESKIPPSEYNGSMQRSYPEIDGANGPQQFLLNISMQLKPYPNIMVEFRTRIVDKVMEKFMLGKYSNSSQLDLEKYIHTKPLIEKFAIFCLKNGIHEDTYQKAYVTLIDKYEATCNDPFNIILEKTKAFNDAFNLVQRHAESECNDVESFIFMANAYSQRLGAFGGMLYGAIEENVANHFSDLNFKFAQNMTFHNKEFQELSLSATYELVKSLDYRINLDGLQKYLFCAISNKNEINFPHESYDFIEWNDILIFFDYASTIPIVTVDILNNFISENKLPNMVIRKQLFGEV